MTSIDINEEEFGPEDDLLEDVELEKPLPPKKESFNPLTEISEMIFYLCLICSLTFLFLNYVGQRTGVDGDSMNTTLQDGQSVYLDKLTYRFNDPQRYDVIVFDYPEEINTRYIKRVIGLPGETIQIIDGYVYVDKNDGNGLCKLEDDVFQNPILERAYGVLAEPFTLKDGEYFVMGDNRNISHDSRKVDVGPVTKDQIQGKVRFVIWPLNEISVL